MFLRNWLYLRLLPGKQTQSVTVASATKVRLSACVCVRVCVNMQAEGR